MGSLAESGQLLPIVVVRSDAVDRYVVIDGFKRIRAAGRLRWDGVSATTWEMGEVEALLLERTMRSGDPEGALEQGWLLRELRDRFGLAQSELARRFDRTVSWVSRRLALVGELPAPIQEHVREGRIPAYGAMRSLVPLARANAAACERLVTAVASHRPTSRQLGELCAGWASGSRATRERLLADPLLYLRSLEESRRRAPADAKSPFDLLVEDFSALGGLARRVHRRVRSGLVQRVLPSDRSELSRCIRQARCDADALFRHLDREEVVVDVGSGDPDGDSRVAAQGACNPGDRPGAEGVAGGGA